MNSVGLHRPRNVDWKRAAALLYGDWGTSKAYVIGLAFVAAGYGSFPIILAVCALTAVVGCNYITICKHFPDGGGVYSAARNQSRLLAVMGALLLVANFTVTAAMSGWAAMSYFGVPGEFVREATVGTILFIGLVNFFGAKHGGSLAVSLAIPMVAVVGLIIILSLPYLTTEYLEPVNPNWKGHWIAFVGVILALSGVEAVANLTGVMKLDAGSTMENPRVASTARKAIWPVSAEVVLGTALLGWAMLSIPRSLSDTLTKRWEDILRFLAEYYGEAALGPAFGKFFGFFVGIMVGLLLLSAVNTAISALIGLIYTLAKDGEMPRSLARLNPYGVPWWPLGLAVAVPILVVSLAGGLESLAGLYAIGVIGAITVNLGSCSLNWSLRITWYERVLMTLTFLVLFAVEMTIAKTKPDALFFACCVVGIGLGLRGFAQRRAGLRTVTVSQEVAAAVSLEAMAPFRINPDVVQSIMVAARGFTSVLRFAFEEAKLRQATLYVLYVKELAVNLPGPLSKDSLPRWQNDRQASRIMYGMLDLGAKHKVDVIPLYAVSDSPATTILELSAMMGIDILMLGASHRTSLVNILKGNVVTEVARDLPEHTQLVIYS